MKIGIILGTRPEIIKMSPVIRFCEKKSIEYFILHSGQHYSYQLDKVFFDELELPDPKYNLEAGSGNQGEQTAKIIAGIEKVLLMEKPDIILVQGDTNTVLAGALAAVKMGIKIGHVEAGLRSYDRSMPEEINRILTDHCADYLFAPTDTAESNLLQEGIPKNKIFICGNTVVDAVHQNLTISKHNQNLLKSLHLQSRGYLLLTAHRKENVDVRERLQGIFEGAGKIYDEFAIPVLFPVHPRTRQKIADFGLATPKGLELVEPYGYLDFLQLEEHARLVMTDSGGLQEECCIMQVPCITLRDNTERPETLEVGANKLVGCDPERIITGAREMISKKRQWPNPFGNGKTAESIIDILGG
jgi:UDP-N-acetylglucosamine 2-epimerase (non-hydrolysing)